MLKRITTTLSPKGRNDQDPPDNSNGTVSVPVYV